MRQDSGILTALNGVAFTYPEDGKSLDPFFFHTVSIEQASGATVAVAFDYGFGFVDSSAVTTNTTFIAPAVKKLQITATGADCDFRVYSADQIGGV